MLAIPFEVTLANIAAVDDFTDVLRAKYTSDLAATMGVPTDQVKIITVMQGSVVVETAIVVPADVDTALITEMQERLTAGGGAPIVSEEVFGAVTASVRSAEAAGVTCLLRVADAVATMCLLTSD